MGELSENTNTSTPEISVAEPLPTAIVRVKPEQDVLVRAFYDQALGLKEYAEQRVITTVADLKPATDDLSIIAKVKKGLNEKRAEYLKPLEEHKQAIRDAFDTLLEPILQADKITCDKILAFQQEQKRIRREQEEINRMRMEAAQKELALKGEQTEPVELVEVVLPPPKKVSTDMGTTGMVDHWKYEVFDFALLPNEYKLLDTAMLNAIAKKHHDTKQIPGVRFYNEPYIATRTR